MVTRQRCEFSCGACEIIVISEAAAFCKGDDVTIPFCNQSMVYHYPTTFEFEFAIEELTKVPHYCNGTLCALANLINGKLDVLSHGFHQSIQRSLNAEGDERKP